MSNMIEKRILMALVAIVSVVSDILAQTDTTIYLDPAVVTGTKIEISKKLVPLAVSQITQSDIEQSGEINVLPMLNDVAPGVFVTERGILGFGVATGAAGKVSIRGLGGTPNTQVLMMIDGHPQYAGLFSHPLPDAYVSSDVEKVEIIRGPASVLYGANAMGGVINLITKRAEQPGWHGQLQAGWGSFGTQRYSASTQWTAGKWGIFAALNHDRTNGVRDSSDFRITNGYLKVTRELSEHWHAMADFNVAYFDYSDPGPTFAPASQYMDIERGKIAISLRNQYDRSSGTFQAYYNFGNHQISDGFSSVDHNAGFTLHQSFSLSKSGTLTAGLDFKNYGGNANRGFRANEDLSINELGIYTYYQHLLTDRFAINGGLRWENNEFFGNFLSPFAGTTLSVSDQSTLKGAVSRGFRSPAIFEMFLFLPNPELQPESLWNYELSYQYDLGGKLSLEATGFVMEGDNLIQLVFGPGGPARQNVANISHHGLELGARYLPLPGLKFTGNFSYLGMKDPLLAAPKYQFNFITQFNRDPYSFRLALRQISKLYTSLDPQTAENYTLLNLHATWKIAPTLQLQGSLRNLLDQSYQINAGYPMPGINWRIGFRWHF